MVQKILHRGNAEKLTLDQDAWMLYKFPNPELQCPQGEDKLEELLVRVQEGRIRLSRLLFSLGQTEGVAYPDIATKAKAQAYIGLDAETLRHEKKIFQRTVVPGWDEIAAEREKTYPVSSLFK